MSYDLQADWEKFREITKEYSERMLNFFPESSKEDWLVICYQSFDAFLDRFPSPEARDEILEYIERVDEEIRDAIEDCRPIFDAMPVEQIKPFRQKWQKFKLELYVFIRYDFPDSLRNMRRRIWNKRIKLWWHRLFVRRNEFHPSLNMDVEAMMVMDEEELERYCEDLAIRRAIAHNRDLARNG